MSKKTTIQDIAGFCPEEAIWKMIYDVSGLLLQEDADYVLTPDSVVIDGQMFIIEPSHDSINEFLAPEQSPGLKSNAKELVWSLGAIAYYVTTGHIVFGGYGGHYQKEHPTVALPILPKGLQSLTYALQQCLRYKPEERISLKNLNELSREGMVHCGKLQRKNLVQTGKEHKIEKNHYSEKWPEEMIEV